MRLLFVPVMAIGSLLLVGCASAPNAPTLTLETNKTPDAYIQCVVPKLQKNSLTPTVSQSSRHVRVVVTSKIAADNVLEAYKVSTGGKVFLYERKPLASTFKPSRFEQVAKECL